MQELEKLSSLDLIDFLPGNIYFTLNTLISSSHNVLATPGLLDELNDQEKNVLDNVNGRTYNEYSTQEAFTYSE